MKHRILRDNSGKTDAQVGDFALHIATSMNGNANFTTPPMTPAVLTSQGNALNLAVKQSHQRHAR